MFPRKGAKLKVLVTEPSFLSTLGIIRSLAKKGIEVRTLGDRSLHGLDVSFRSRYSKEGIVGPSPRKEEYVDFLIQVLKDRNIDVLIPAGYWSAEKIAKNRGKLDKLLMWKSRRPKALPLRLVRRKPVN
jgi:hypothetical protein